MVHAQMDASCHVKTNTKVFYFDLAYICQNLQNLLLRKILSDKRKQFPTILMKPDEKKELENDIKD